jgi:hypothetical protein
MQPLYTGEISVSHKQIVWSILESLMEGVGCEPTEKVEAGVMFLTTRKLSGSEVRGLTANRFAGQGRDVENCSQGALKFFCPNL